MQLFKFLTYIAASLFEILDFVLEMMGKLARRNGQPVLPWMQCQGCKDWFKNAEKIKNFNKFGTSYCDNCWMYWDYYFLYYPYYYFYFLQGLRCNEVIEDNPMQCCEE